MIQHSTNQKEVGKAATVHETSGKGRCTTIVHTYQESDGSITGSRGDNYGPPHQPQGSNVMKKHQ
jgi:hypothetical protein